MSISVNHHWGVSQQKTLHWRQWGDDAVVFDEEAGQTHFVNLMTLTTLKILERKNYTLVDLNEQVGEELNLEVDNDLQVAVGQIVKRFDELGLIEPNNGSGHE